MAILVLGEALIDEIDEKPIPGGSPFNIARAAAKLGASVHYAGAISYDNHGDNLLQELIAAGVSTGLVKRIAAPTAIVRVVGEPPQYLFSLRSSAALVFPSFQGYHPQWVSYGSVASLLEPFAASLLGYLHESHAQHFFDPNLRPAALPPGFALAERVNELAALADVIRLSSEDLALLPADSPRTWLAGRTKAVIITRGADHTSVRTRAGQVDIPVFPATPFADSVGAGDTVSGALLTELSNLSVIPTALDCWKPLVVNALAAAAITCTRVGAQPPTRAEVTRFLAARAGVQ